MPKVKYSLDDINSLLNLQKKAFANLTQLDGHYLAESEMEKRFSPTKCRQRE